MAISSLKELADKARRLDKAIAANPQDTGKIYAASGARNEVSGVEIKDNGVAKTETRDPMVTYENMVTFLKQCPWFKIEFLGVYSFYKAQETTLLQLRVEDPNLIAALGSNIVLVHIGFDTASEHDYLSLAWKINDYQKHSGTFSTNFCVFRKIIYLPGDHLLISDATRLAFLIEQLRIFSLKQQKGNQALKKGVSDPSILDETKPIDFFQIWLNQSAHKFDFLDPRFKSLSILHNFGLNFLTKELMTILDFLFTNALPPNFFGNSSHYRSQNNVRVPQNKSNRRTKNNQPRQKPSRRF